MSTWSVVVAVVVGALPGPAWQHGGLVWPPPWQDGDHLDIEQVYTWQLHHHPVQHEQNTGKKIQNVNAWLTDQAYLGGHGAEEFRGGAGKVTNTEEGGCDKHCRQNKVPWSAPGVAPALGGGCGVFGGNPFGCHREVVDLQTGETTVVASTHADPRPPGSPCLGGGTWMGGGDAREVEFPQAASTGWLLGSVQQVGWVSKAWHQGGYTYRLCPLGEEGRPGLTEECFQQNVLTFASNTTRVRLTGKENIGQWQDWPQTDLSSGTQPAGSAWRPAGIHHEPHRYIRADEVVVPAHLPPGDYVLSFRWDGATPDGQVWLSCANVRLVN